MGVHFSVEGFPTGPKGTRTSVTTTFIESNTNMNIYSRDSGLDLPRRAILWELLLIWFQQNVSRRAASLHFQREWGAGERKWGREKRKQGRLR